MCVDNERRHKLIQCDKIVCVGQMDGIRLFDISLSVPLLTLTPDITNIYLENAGDRFMQIYGHGHKCDNRVPLFVKRKILSIIKGV